MTNPNKTLIAVVLDRSGSMSLLKRATLEGLNAFFYEQRKLPGSVEVFMAQFSDFYAVTRDYVDLATMKDLTEWDYLVGGGTALYDAIGKTVVDVGDRLAKMKEADRPSKVIVVVQTDGAENSSKEFKIETIREMLAHQTTKYDWQFVFLGANQDAVLTGTELGFFAANSLTYNATARSTTKGFDAMSQSIGSYRISGNAQSIGTTMDSFRKGVVDEAVDTASETK